MNSQDDPGVPTAKIIELNPPTKSARNPAAAKPIDEPNDPPGNILPGVEVLGRTTESSGCAIVLQIATAGHAFHAHYLVEELLKDHGSRLAADLAKAGHIEFARGKALRSVANEILRQAAASKTIVLDGTGLTILKVPAGTYSAYVWNGRAYWFGEVPPFSVIASKVAPTQPRAGTSKGWRIHVGRRLRRNHYLIVMVVHGLAAAIRRLFGLPVLVLIIIGGSEKVISVLTAAPICA